MNYFCAAPHQQIHHAEKNGIFFVHCLRYIVTIQRIAENSPPLPLERDVVLRAE